MPGDHPTGTRPGQRLARMPARNGARSLLTAGTVPVFDSEMTGARTGGPIAADEPGPREGRGRLPAQPAAPAPALPAMSGTGRILMLQRSVGNQAVARMLAAPSVARQPATAAAPPQKEFNAGSIVNDLRRAIDQSDVTEVWVGTGGYGRPTKRAVDAALVIRVLDELTLEQVRDVEELYLAKEKSSLRKDLFAGGQSDHPANLTDDERARLEVLLGGTVGGEGAEDNRLAAEAIELHEMLAGKVDEAKRERVVAFHRRPVKDITAIEQQYERRYGHHPLEDLNSKLGDMHLNRVAHLRDGKWAVADAIAIDAKRRQLAELQEKFESGRLDFHEMAGYEAKRRKLIDGITGVLEMNRQEALLDPASEGKTSTQAIDERISQILAVPAATPGRSLGDELATTLSGTAAAGVVDAMVDGSVVQSAVRRLIEMEARDTTRSAKIAELLRELRRHAAHDVMAQIPGLDAATKEALLKNPILERDRLVDEKAKLYVKAFTEIYDSVRAGKGRSWKAIVKDADSENREMLDAMVEGGGQMTPVQDLRFGIRKKDAARINAVLKTQGSQENIRKLEEQYDKAYDPNLREALFGIFGAERAMGPASIYDAQMRNQPAVRGRAAAAALEHLSVPGEAELGKASEANWISDFGKLEVKVTEDNSGAIGFLRELGEDPETQKLMNQSGSQLNRLYKAFLANAGNDRLQAAIIAEMKKVRATLTGDASAYEEENEQIAAQVRSAVSLAVQVAMAVALPGVGTGLSGFIATTALNIGGSVVSNMAIYGDKYDLGMFYDDVVGGGFGALGGKFGDDFAKLAGKQVAGKAAEGAIQAARAAKLAPKLVDEAGQAAAMAVEASRRIRALAEASNIAGSTALQSAATGQDGFTAEGLIQSFLMNRLGLLKGGDAAARPAGEPAPSGPEARPVPGAEGGAVAPEGAPAAQGADGGPAVREPSRPAHDAPLPAGATRPADPGAAGGPPGAARPGSAADRLEARGMWRSMEQLASQWTGMGEAGKAAGLTDVVNDMVTRRDIPSIRIVAEAAGAGHQGAFDYHKWTIRIDPALLNQPSMPPDLVRQMNDLARHELEHVLQWWSMARLRASQKATPDQIIADMHGIPPDVAVEAVRSVERDGMSRAEQAAAQVWWDSVYSPVTTRNVTLNARASAIAQRDALRAEIDAAVAKGDRVDPAKRRELSELELQVAGFESLYRGLPEEVIAYDKGGGAGREAELMQLELEHQLTVDGLKIAHENLKEVESEYMESVAAGRHADPQLAADHAAALASLKTLQEQAVATRAKVRAATEAMQPAGQPAGGDPSAPTTPAAAPGGPAPVAGGTAAMPGGSPAGPRPSPGETPAERLRDLGLADRQVERLTDKGGLTEARVRELHASVGTEGLAAIAAAKSNAQMKRALEVVDRVAPLRGDPAVGAGLARLTEASGGGRRGMSPLSAAELLHDVPVGELPSYLRVIGTEGFPHPAGLRAEQRAALHDPNVLALVDRYGPGVFRELSSREKLPILEKLAAQAKTPSPEADALVNSVLEARTPAKQRQTLGEKAAPRRRRAVERVEADETDPLWKSGAYKEMADDFIKDHPDYLTQATAPDKDGASLARDQVEHLLATLYQSRDLARRGHYEGFSEARKLALLDDFDKQTRAAGLYGNWTGVANNLRGSLSEALFTPRGLQKQIRLTHPAKQAAAGEPPPKIEISIIDYELTGDLRVLRTDKRELVEQKSDDIRGVAGDKDPSPGGVAAAKLYVKHALLDAPAVRAADGVLMIEFVRPPGNEATRHAMLEILFKDPDAFGAVRFGGGPWITREQWIAERAALPAPVAAGVP
jgi:hypothetical protein